MSPFVAYEEARFRSFSGLLNEALCAVPGMCCWGGMLGDTWGSAMGLRWKWVLLVTSTTGSCSWISKNICERQRRQESNWRRKRTHTIVSSMQAVLLVTHGLSLNTRLDIKHFPSFMQQLSSARNVTRSWKEEKKNRIFWIAGCMKSNLPQLHKCRTTTKQDTFTSDAAMLLNSVTTQAEHVFLLYRNRSSQHGAAEAFFKSTDLLPISLLCTRFWWPCVVRAIALATHGKTGALLEELRHRGRHEAKQVAVNRLRESWKPFTLWNGRHRGHDAGGLVVFKWDI